MTRRLKDILNLALYESSGEWDLALEEYRIASLAESDSLAEEARDGIKRVLQQENSFGEQVRDDLSDFSVGVASNLVKVVAVAAAFLILARLVLVVVERQRPLWAAVKRGRRSGFDMIRFPFGYHLKPVRLGGRAVIPTLPHFK